MMPCQRRLAASVLALAALIGGCAQPPIVPLPAPLPAPPQRLTVLHTNDHHGHFWRDPQGQAGLAARKTLVDAIRDEVRAAGGQVLLLDAGDVNTGTPESDLLEAEPDFRGMSLLGYDAMAVGNHEFDRSAEVQQRQRTQWSNFPWLSANVRRDGALLFDPYRIVQVGRLRVAVIGLTTEDTRLMGVEGRYPGVRFEAAIPAAQRLVPELRRQADAVIALTHLGHHVDGRHGLDAPDDVQLARAVGGIDLVVGGHTHSLICLRQQAMMKPIDATTGPCQPDRQNGAWIVQAGDRGRYLGRADFVWHDGRLALERYRLLPVGLTGTAAVPDDPPMRALLAPFQARGAAGLDRPLGRAEGRFDGERSSVRQHPTALGQWVAGVLQAAAQADLAIISGGGLRASLPDGAITQRDLLTALPFRNRLVVVRLSGQALAEHLQAVARHCAGGGAYPHFSGVSFVRQGDVLSDVRIGGEALQPDRTYRLALPSFLAGGGDGHPDLRGQAGLHDTGLIDSDLLADQLRSVHVIRAVDFQPKNDRPC